MILLSKNNYFHPSNKYIRAANNFSLLKGHIHLVAITLSYKNEKRIKKKAK